MVQSPPSIAHHGYVHRRPESLHFIYWHGALLRIPLYLINRGTCYTSFKNFLLPFVAAVHLLGRGREAGHTFILLLCFATAGEEGARVRGLLRYHPGTKDV